jgi:hypothetical protein
MHGKENVMMVELTDYTKKVFISYVRKNSADIDKICSEFKRNDVEYWLDRDQIVPGEFWKKAIKDAIKSGAYFLACFSREYENKTQTYMNEELILAIEILRIKAYDSGWFIPIKLSDCKIPDMDIGAGKTLNDIQCLNLFEDWGVGLKRLIDIITRFNVDLQPTNEELKFNSQYQVEVIEVELIEQDDELPNPEPIIITKRLSKFGFKVSIGGWSGSRLLSKLPPEQMNSLYVIHRSNPELSGRIVRALRHLRFAPRVVPLSTKEVAEDSEKLAEESIVENVDAIVAYRSVA